MLQQVHHRWNPLKYICSLPLSSPHNPKKNSFTSTCTWLEWLYLNILFQGGVWPTSMLEILTVLPEEVCYLKYIYHALKTGHEMNGKIRTCLIDAFFIPLWHYFTVHVHAHTDCIRTREVAFEIYEHITLQCSTLTSFLVETPHLSGNSNLASYSNLSYCPLDYETPPPSEFLRTL